MYQGLFRITNPLQTAIIFQACTSNTVKCQSILSSYKLTIQFLLVTFLGIGIKFSISRTVLATSDHNRIALKSSQSSSFPHHCSITFSLAASSRQVYYFLFLRSGVSSIFYKSICKLQSKFSRRFYFYCNSRFSIRSLVAHPKNHLTSFRSSHFTGSFQVHLQRRQNIQKKKRISIFY